MNRGKDSGGMQYIGINIGAVAVKVVCLAGDRARWRAAAHQGRPLEVMQSLLAEFPGEAFYGVSGDLGHISEVAATEAALEFVGGGFDAVASLGGEAFAVYLVDGTRVLSVLSHNKCAAGSGHFLVQQTARLGLDLEAAIERSFQGKVVPLASRCSVHCKSDITHKLNRHEATVEDVLATLHDSMASKVVALLERAPRRVRRLLAVGGVSQNRAMMAALRSKLADTQVVVLPESACFEALGTALVTRGRPQYRSPQIAPLRPLGRLPGLAQYADRVTVRQASHEAAPGDGPLVLGVDAGSTTTKAVLVDPRTCRIVASDYRRTAGDPLRATRQCLEALAGQVDERPVCLASATGSARELVGAYLGTPHVYNEISAHAAGAAHFDPEVDTIFEIGGQDAKYIFLRNGSPIDYAMNAACSAGTGSFLEECAQGDLGLPLEQIAEVALRAGAPVQFKATCAAFINSDIRSALQQGCSREDVAAGLVAAVVQNYLTTVKGRRPVGRKVLFQGGVAVNRAVGHAFAQALDRAVVIPPHPELLGALGVALLALERAGGAGGPARALRALAAPTMKVTGRFTCRSCTNHCIIERFEVAGRRFPFGGRCSRYENVRTRRHREEVADLVARRNERIFAATEGQEHSSAQTTSNGRCRIGIPRALTTHSLFPLYATFFQQLGMDVILSGIDPAGWWKAHSGFCFPVQLAHGAVLDLVKKGVKTVFLPHVNRMPNPRAGRDSFLCPVTQASPYFIAKAFPEVTFVSPMLNFAHGYETCDELVDAVSFQLDVPRTEAEAAYRQAVEVQEAAERRLRELGREALEEALADGRTTILLVGRAYNAFPPEASQSVGRKLASMGVRVIPGDCLPPERTGPTSWHYPNIILNVVELACRHPHLFLLYVSNFSCTIDAFVHSMLASRLESKPYLILEIDAHTADAGVQTRLEAFLDIIENRSVRPAPPRPFVPARIDLDGTVYASSGKAMRLDDPRVKLYFPSFSYYHARAVGLLARWLGLNAGPPIDLDRRQLERGLQYTSGRECLPLPISIGQMLEAHERRQSGEIVGFYMLRGGAPCVVDCYVDYFRQFIRENRLEDLFIFDPREDNDYYGLDVRSLAQSLAPLVTLADIFVELEQSLKVVGQAGAVGRLRDCWNQEVGTADSLRALKNRLEKLVDRVAAIPHGDPAACAKVLVTGDFFTRFSPSFMEGVHEIYTRHGIILVPVDLNELFLYGAYAGMATAAEDLGVSSDSRWATALACVNLFRREGREYVANWVQY
ncbi:MAG TPA: hypothetical protein EYH34_12200, partial [Planctomycetes bacterium]|nr:hypothetical protein [Planctomycetota bacterium]